MVSKRSFWFDYFYSPVPIIKLNVSQPSQSNRSFPYFMVSIIQRKGMYKKNTTVKFYHANRISVTLLWGDKIKRNTLALSLPPLPHSFPPPSAIKMVSFMFYDIIKRLDGSPQNTANIVTVNFAATGNQRHLQTHTVADSGTDSSNSSSSSRFNRQQSVQTQSDLR